MTVQDTRPNAFRRPWSESTGGETSNTQTVRSALRLFLVRTLVLRLPALLRVATLLSLLLLLAPAFFFRLVGVLLVRVLGVGHGLFLFIG